MHTLELPVGSSQQATIMAFGPEDAAHYGLTSWSLKNLQHEADIPANRKLANRLSEELDGLGVLEAFAPNVAVGSGLIIDTRYLNDRILLNGSRLFRNHGLPADGIMLEAGQAFVMSAAGCPIIIGVAGDDMIVTHAARDSLIDRGAVMGKPRRKHVSVVDAMIEKFQKRGALPNDIVMVMLFAIPAKEFKHSFTHPKYGEYNQALAKFIVNRWSSGFDWINCCLDLELVFVEQARRAGVLRAWAGHSLTQYPHLVHTCIDENVNKRNLFIVKRNA